MGLTDNAILTQSKKAQGETNVRLDALVAEVRRTNELLGQLLTALTAGRAETDTKMAGGWTTGGGKPPPPPPPPKPDAGT
jgi:hypothetical protein